MVIIWVVVGYPREGEVSLSLQLPLGWLASAFTSPRRTLDFLCDTHTGREEITCQLSVRYTALHRSIGIHSTCLPLDTILLSPF